MRLRRDAASFAVVFAIYSGNALAASGDERPQARAQVMLDVTPPESAVVPLLRAELRALGLDIVDEASGVAAPIMVHIVLTGESLDVRIADRTTGRTTDEETFAAPGGRSMDPRTAVLHAVELLRWHLRFAPTSSGPTAPAPVVETKPAQPVSPPPASNIRVGLTPVALYSPGGTGLGLGGQIDVLKRWGRLGARGLGGSAVVPNTMSVPEGSVEVTARWVGLAGVLIVGGERRTLLELGLGAAIFASELRGKANGGNVSRDDRLVTAAPFGEVTLRQRITPGIALRLVGASFIPLRSSRLLVLDREIGRYGQAAVTLGIGVELTLF